MGKRSTQVASLSRLKSSSLSSRHRAATSRSTLRATTMVVSPRNSSTSLIALGLHPRNRSTTTLPACLLSSATVFPKSPSSPQLLMPVERALFPKINIPDQEDGNVHQHLEEAVSPHLPRLRDHIAIDVSPGV